MPRQAVDEVAPVGNKTAAGVAAASAATAALFAAVAVVQEKSKCSPPQRI